VITLREGKFCAIARRLTPRNLKKFSELYSFVGKEERLFYS